MAYYLGVVPARGDLTWVIIELDDKGQFSLHSKKKEVVPDLGSRHLEMAWVYTKITETFDRDSISASCVVQGAVGQSRSEAVLFRAQVEGVILAALSSLKMSISSHKRTAILTNLGLKRGAKLDSVEALQILRERSPFPKYFDEAVVAAFAACN